MKNLSKEKDDLKSDKKRSVGGVILTEENEQDKEGRASKTKISEQSEEAVCRICLGTE